MEELGIWFELAKQDAAAESDLDTQYIKTLAAVGELEMRNMLGDEADRMGAIMKINSGAGGTESNDW